MDKTRLLILVENVENAFYTHNCDYSFEDGVIYDDNGKLIDIEIEALKQDTKDIIQQMESDCKKLIELKCYGKSKDNIRILERLNSLEIELNK